MMHDDDDALYSAGEAALFALALVVWGLAGYGLWALLTSGCA